MITDVLVGVIHLNQCDFDPSDYQIADLGYESAVADRAKEMLHEASAGGILDHQVMDRDFRAEAAEEMADLNFESPGPILLGGWKIAPKFSPKQFDKYEPDFSNYSFAAIYHPESGYIQVIESEYVRTDCRMCSPCYPNQADLGNTGAGVIGYCLPPEMLQGKLLDLVHINFLEDGFKEENWDDALWHALRIQAHNIMREMGIDPKQWVPYRNGLEWNRDPEGYGLSLDLIDDSGHLMNITTVVPTGSKIGVNTRLFLDSNDRRIAPGN